VRATASERPGFAGEERETAALEARIRVRYEQHATAVALPPSSGPELLSPGTPSPTLQRETDRPMPTSTGPKPQGRSRSVTFPGLSAFAARPAVWVALTLAVAAVDYLVGPHVHVGLLYLLPLALAAWFGRTAIALAIALALPIARLSYFVFDVWTRRAPSGTPSSMQPSEPASWRSR
jgi:hypothetical protein